MRLLGVFIYLLLSLSHSYARFAETLKLDVRAFGAKGDGVSDDWWAFQRAINRAAENPTGGVVVIPSPQPQRSWRISHALRLYSLVTLNVPDPTTIISCSGDAKRSDETGALAQDDWGFSGCLLLGSMFSPSINSLPTLPIERSERGSYEIALRNISDISNLAAGDLVAVETTPRYFMSPKPGSSYRPAGMEVERIEAVLPNGQLRFRYALLNAGSTVLRRLTNMAKTAHWPNLILTDGRDTGIPLFASFQAGVTGGRWETKRRNAAFISTGGAVECVIMPKTVVAGFGVGYGNLYERCKMSVDSEIISQVPLELAFHSEHNEITLGTVTASGLEIGRLLPRWYIAIDESSRFNNVTAVKLVIKDGAPDKDHPANRFGTDAVLISAASCNTIAIQTLAGSDLEGNTIHISSPNYPGNPPWSFGNVIVVGSSEFENQKRFVLIDGAGSGDNVVRIERSSGNAMKASVASNGNDTQNTVVVGQDQARNLSSETIQSAACSQ